MASLQARVIVARLMGAAREAEVAKAVAGSEALSGIVARRRNSSQVRQDKIELVGIVLVDLQARSGVGISHRGGPRMRLVLPLATKTRDIHSYGVLEAGKLKSWVVMEGGASGLNQ